MGNILSNHFQIIRKRLTAEGEIANGFHHKGNKGFIREAFARELLDNSTSQFCSVGSGEIIHREMDDDEERNQIDVILYNNRYPKLYGAGGIDLFFVETVSSFIEIKSTLSKADIRQAAQASKRVKSYPYAAPQRFNATGMVKTPRPFSYLFAYDTDAADIVKIAEWMQEVAAEEDYGLDDLKEAPPETRPFFPHTFLDGVFVLNRGHVSIDSGPFQSPLVGQTDVPLDHIWIFDDDCELEYLWAAVNVASEKLLWNEIEFGDYLQIRERKVSD